MVFLIRQGYAAVEHWADRAGKYIFDDGFHDKLINSHGQGLFFVDRFIKSGAQDHGDIRFDFH